MTPTTSAPAASTASATSAASATSRSPDAAPDLDSLIHAQLTQLGMGLSPASLAAAWIDWLGHLAISPGKLQQLALHAMQPVDASTGPDCRDRRFASAAWQRWPYAALAQSFQQIEAWWLDATRGVHGVSPHHEQQAAFVARQLLDMVSPSNLAWTNPEVLQATLDSGGLNLLHGAQLQWQDQLRRLAPSAAPAEAAFVPGRDVAVTPGQVVLRNHLIELIQYAPQTKTVHTEPVLIVPPWIMKYYILDLMPSDSLVRWLVAQGHTVFIVSWRNPGAEDRSLGMDDYLKSGALAALDAVSAIVPQAGVHALGYCLGGTLLGIAAATLARERDTRLRSLSLLATQLDFSEPGDLSLFIDDPQLDVLDDLMARQGYLDGEQMAGAFTMLNARDLLWSRLVGRYLLGRQPPPNDLAAWNADATRMPWRQHSEYLRRLYRDNDLARGRYRVDGRPVALGDIRLPVFALGTQRDTVVPWRSAYKVHLLARGEITFCLTSGGHNVGVVNPPGAGVKRSYQLHTHRADDLYLDPDGWLASASTHDGSWWPAWQAWLVRQGARGSRRVAPPPMGHVAAGYAPLQAAPGSYVLMP